MSDLNLSLVSGNLGADPRMSYTSGGSAVCHFSLATNSYSKNKDTGERVEYTEWHDVVLFGRKAETAGELLRKGLKVFVKGPSHTRKWKDSQNIERYRKEIKGEEFQILSPSNERAEAGQ